MPLYRRLAGRRPQREPDHDPVDRRDSTLQSLWTTTRRALRGESPLRPDRAHFHHKLLDAGFGVRGAFFVLICVGLFLAAVGVLMHLLEVRDNVSFAAWLLAGLGVVVLMHNARVLWRVLPSRLRRTQRPIEIEST